MNEVPLGHDKAAHDAYSVLLRYGVESIDQLAGRSDEELRQIVGPGKAFGRIRALVPEPAIEPAECFVCRTQAIPGTPYARLTAEVSLGHDKIAHGAYNALLRFGIESIDQLAGRSDEELRQIPRLGKDTLERIRTVVALPVDTESTWLSEDVTILRGGAVRAVNELSTHHYALGAAIAVAMRSAADEIELCDRINARSPDADPTERPSPTAEALAVAARIYRSDTPVPPSNTAAEIWEDKELDGS